MDALVEQRTSRLSTPRPCSSFTSWLSTVPVLRWRAIHIRKRGNTAAARHAGGASKATWSAVSSRAGPPPGQSTRPLPLALLLHLTRAARCFGHRSSTRRLSPARGSKTHGARRLVPYRSTPARLGRSCVSRVNPGTPWRGASAVPTNGRLAARRQRCLPLGHGPAPAGWNYSRPCHSVVVLLFLTPSVPSEFGSCTQRQNHHRRRVLPAFAT